jgi:hypothetical protein
MDATKWFTKSEREIVLATLQVVADANDLEMEDLTALFGLDYTDPLNQLAEKYAKYRGDMCQYMLSAATQCSRRPAGCEHKFCKQHLRIVEKDGTKATTSVASTHLGATLERLRSVRKRYGDLALVVRDDEDFLMDPRNARVYAFETMELVGKMNSMGKIFRIHAE